MARFDVYAQPQGDGYLLDCQSNMLDALSTRFVVPLIPLERAPVPGVRLNPIFDLEGIRHSMVTQFAGAVPARDLRQKVASFADRHDIIMNALDMLIIGY